MRLYAFPSVTAPVFAFAFTLAVASGCSRPDTPPPPPPPPPAKVDQDLVDLALHDCFFGNCETAHSHLSQVTVGSPARQSVAYRAVQYRYDADRMLRADVEPDLQKRRALYSTLAASLETDGGLRLAASERIARLGIMTPGGGGASEIALNARTDAPSPSVVAAQEVAALLVLSRSKDPADLTQVREKLEPKIYSGKATRDDLAMLRTVCKTQRDTTCLRQLDKLILP